MFKARLHQVRLWGEGAGGDLTIINADYVADLAAHGYLPRTIQLYVEVVEELSHWLVLQPVMRRGALEELLGRFIRVYGARCRRRHWPAYRMLLCRRALQRWLVFLREKGWARPPAAPPSTGSERLVRAYDRHLAEVRGLAVGTRRNHAVRARRFLRWLSPKRCLKQLGPKEVLDYVVECSRCFPVATARDMASALRSWLRFLAWARKCRPWLDQAVPALAPWPRGELRRGLNEEEYRRFLASFERTTPLGRRNYALALCLGELGLRAGEAAGLQLKDLDWRRQVLRLPQTKGRRERQLPVPAQVSRALADYLQRGRPPSACLAVFVRHRPPLDQPLSRAQVGSAMSCAFERAGLWARGAHVLRYRLATRLQQRGVGLKAIADLLGHQSLESTARYARVHFEALRQAALPWPEVWR